MGSFLHTNPQYTNVQIKQNGTNFVIPRKDMCLVLAAKEF